MLGKGIADHNWPQTAFFCLTSSVYYPSFAPAHLELHLHASDRLPRLRRRQPLNVGEEAAGGDFGAAAADGLIDGVVDENVLILRLDHVVALRAQTGHVAWCDAEEVPAWEGKK